MRDDHAALGAGAAVTVGGVYSLTQFRFACFACSAYFTCIAYFFCSVYFSRFTNFSYFTRLTRHFAPPVLNLIT